MYAQVVLVYFIVYIKSHATKNCAKHKVKCKFYCLIIVFHIVFVDRTNDHVYQELNELKGKPYIYIYTWKSIHK
jgi:hypothetical protein